MEFLQPKDWAKAKGYANGVVADGKLIVLGGQIGWNNEQEFERRIHPAISADTGEHRRYRGSRRRTRKSRAADLVYH